MFPLRQDLGGIIKRKQPFYCTFYYISFNAAKTDDFPQKFSSQEYTPVEQYQLQLHLPQQYPHQVHNSPYQNNRVIVQNDHAAINQISARRIRKLIFAFALFTMTLIFIFASNFIKY